VVKFIELARSLERKTGSIRNCIEQGTIPPALVRLAGNVRAWPVAEANAIIAAARGERILSKPQAGRVRVNARVQAGTSEAAGALT
jgi:hypothetical protein